MFFPLGTFLRRKRKIQKRKLQIRLTKKLENHLASLTYKAVRKKKTTTTQKVHETIQSLCKGLARKNFKNRAKCKYSRSKRNTQKATFTLRANSSYLSAVYEDLSTTWSKWHIKPHLGERAKTY